MKFSKIFSIFILTFFIFSWIVPVYMMFKISLSEPKDVLTPHPSFLPKSITFSHWKEAISSENIISPFKKSLIVATLTAIISLIIAIPGAYVLAKIPGVIGYYVVIFIFFTRMFPEIGIALPITVNFIKLGLFDSSFGLVLAHIIKVLPIATWILIGTFKTIPRDLEESARVDGCGKLNTLFRVALPLAKPGIAVAMIFAWLISWEEFIYATYLCMINKTLPLQVFYYVNRGNWFQSSTYAAVITIPVVIFTFYFQKYLKTGYLSGAIKG